MSTASISQGKVLSFIFFTFGAGLLQLWILFLVLYFSGKNPTISNLLGDGGLYFFSTALAFSSFVGLISHVPLKFGDLSLNITLLVIGPITLIATISYVSSLFSNIGTQVAPFANQLMPQITCFLLASAYAFYVSTITGVFKK